jgi:hypothetical protein
MIIGIPKSHQLGLAILLRFIASRLCGAFGRIDMDDTHPKKPEILTANMCDANLVVYFLHTYRKESSRTSSNIPTACLLEGKRGQSVSDLIPASGDDEIFVYYERDAALRKDLIRNVAAFWEAREPWEDYDFCIFPRSLDWCIGFTHNDYCILVHK